MGNTLNVWFEQTQVGQLILTSGRQAGFVYHEDWLCEQWPISCSLPLPVGGQHNPGTLHANHWQDFAAELGIAPKLVSRIIREQAEMLVANLNDWTQAFYRQNGNHPAIERIVQVIRQQTQKALRAWC